MSLTKTDLRKIENILEKKMGEKSKTLPTKHEFFSQINGIKEELTKINELLMIIST